MSYYIRYFLTDDKGITLSELEQALRTTNPGYEIGDDSVTLDDELFGQIEINEKGDPFFDGDLMLLREFAEKKQNKEFLLTELNASKLLVIVQAIWSRGDDETLKVLDPLFGWLLAHRKGLLVVEGGFFFNRAGEIL